MEHASSITLMDNEGPDFGLGFLKPDLTQKIMEYKQEQAEMLGTGGGTLT